ncbi:MAG: prepilin-type N-terminal cleavage/methylation domain-containing protein [bacterium]|nr:prepilin-type N-terminal cleavage/methylation domain-containing protein [bacterium]
MKYFLQQKNTTKRGFTLVETLLALSIFSISVLAMLSVLSDGISDTNYAKSKIIAVYLAQEGIETMRNMRDTCMLYPTGPICAGWAGFTTKITSAGCTNQTNGCYFNDQNLNFNDPAQPIANQSNVALTACGTSCPLLLYNSTTGKYNYTLGGVSSLFTRKIVATNVSADEYRISSTIYYTHKYNTYQFTISENLFNWAE